MRESTCSLPLQNLNMMQTEKYAMFSLRGVALATLLHERGQQKEALRALTDLVDDLHAQPLLEPWMVFEVLALKSRILSALGQHQRANILAKPALHWLTDGRDLG
jgi:hypothetical protein